MPLRNTNQRQPWQGSWNWQLNQQIQHQKYSSKISQIQRTRGRFIKKVATLQQEEKHDRKQRWVSKIRFIKMFAIFAHWASTGWTSCRSSASGWSIPNVSSKQLIALSVEPSYTKLDFIWVALRLQRYLPTSTVDVTDPVLVLILPGIHFWLRL